MNKSKRTIFERIGIQVWTPKEQLHDDHLGKLCADFQKCNIKETLDYVEAHRVGEEFLKWAEDYYGKSSKILFSTKRFVYKIVRTNRKASFSQKKRWQKRKQEMKC